MSPTMNHWSVWTKGYSDKTANCGHFTTVTVVKLSCHHSTMCATFMPSFVSGISYRPTDSWYKRVFKTVFMGIKYIHAIWSYNERRRQCAQ